MSISVQDLNARIAGETIFINDLLAEINKVIVGQPALIERVLTALLADGHILLEGVPGLAKTLLIKTTAEAIHAQFARIQFTPDLLPADLIGTQVYNPQLGIFAVYRGPLFTNLLLADEINRAPAKVQSALLEAMQERQITIANKTDRLPDLFMVMATQNPIEQEGTYPLPEAQVDRFMFKLLVDYPAQADERVMLERMTSAVKPSVRPVVQPDQILAARKLVREVYMDDRIKDYVWSKKPACLSGEVEADEVYVVAGHKGHPEIVAEVGREGRRRRLKGKRGRGTLADEKPPILGLLQRTGDVVIRMLPNVQQVTIKPVLTQVVQPGSLLYTDEYDIYTRLEEWGYQHKTVNHSAGEYARDEDGDGFHEVHVNALEGFWSLLRSWLRPHRGISQEKLPLYLGFFEFVHNARRRGKALLGALCPCPWP